MANITIKQLNLFDGGTFNPDDLLPVYHIPGEGEDGSEATYKIKIDQILNTPIQGLNTSATTIVSAINQIKTTAREDFYDLIIQTDPNVVDLTEDLTINDFTIIKGDIAELEDKVANGKVINGILVLNNLVFPDWTITHPIKYESFYLPLVNWFGPYGFLNFGGCYKVSPNNSSSCYQINVSIQYDVDTFNLNQFRFETRQV